MSDKKNTLVGQTGQQVDAYHASGSEFPVKNVAAGNKQSGGPKGRAEGQDQLVDYAVNQEGPRHLEDDGPGTPVSKGRASKISGAFPISKNAGESGSGSPSSVSISENINLHTGYVEGGSSRTRVQEVPESKVHIPSR